jgi:hypothetical protein
MSNQSRLLQERVNRQRYDVIDILPAQVIQLVACDAFCHRQKLAAVAGRNQLIPATATALMTSG